MFMDFSLIAPHQQAFMPKPVPHNQATGIIATADPIELNDHAPNGSGMVNLSQQQVLRRIARLGLGSAQRSTEYPPMNTLEQSAFNTFTKLLNGLHHPVKIKPLATDSIADEKGRHLVAYDLDINGKRFVYGFSFVDKPHGWFHHETDTYETLLQLPHGLKLERHKHEDQHLLRVTSTDDIGVDDPEHLPKELPHIKHPVLHAVAEHFFQKLHKQMGIQGYPLIALSKRAAH